MKKYNRNKIGQFTSFRTYWNKNRKQWHTLLFTSFLTALTVLVWGLQTADDISSAMTVEPLQGADKGQLETLDTSFCSLPYVECDLDHAEIKNWVWIRLNQNLGYEAAQQGMAIIECESHWNVDALSSTRDMGLWQISWIHQDISNEQKFNYQIATDWAINKYWKDGDWSAWTCADILNIN